MLQINKAQDAITHINDELHLTCPELTLVFDYYRNLSGTIAQYNAHKNPNKLLLCLYYQDTCISSIELAFDDIINHPQYITINSKTMEGYTNRKYNKFLRSVVIYISFLINLHDAPIQAIISQGVNEITIWQSR